MGFIHRDPCGIFCVLLTYGAFFYADYVILRVIVRTTPNLSSTLWGSFHAVVYNLIVLLGVISHLRAVFSDPGLIPIPSIQEKLTSTDLRQSQSESSWSICLRCGILRPPRSHHCTICERCIRRMDHHCPWINNCVGERNQRFFLQFLFYVGLLSLYSLSLVAYSWFSSSCSSSSSSSSSFFCSKDVLESKVLHTVLLGMESLLFALFVCAIASDQLESIFSDETQVEQAKKQGSYRPNESKISHLFSVFGFRHPLTWLLPCTSLPERHFDDSFIA